MPSKTGQRRRSLRLPKRVPSELCRLIPHKHRQKCLFGKAAYDLIRRVLPDDAPDHAYDAIKKVGQRIPKAPLPFAFDALRRLNKSRRNAKLRTRALENYPVSKIKYRDGKKSRPVQPSRAELDRRVRAQQTYRGRGSGRPFNATQRFGFVKPPVKKIRWRGGVAIPWSPGDGYW